MFNALRSRLLALAVLLPLLAAVSVDLCVVGAPLMSAAQTAFAAACADCGDCCDAGTCEDAHCHACLCACHAVGVLIAAGPGMDLPSAAPLAGGAPALCPAGFHADFERPPLVS
jgi:hypothetical protein